MKVLDKPLVRIRAEGREARKIPTNIRRNSAGPPALEMIRRAGVKKGLEIIIEKNVPVGIGVGSSGATAAACVMALDSALGLGLPQQTLVHIASLGEGLVTGTPHADNVAASLMGGFVVVYGSSPARTVSFKPPQNLEAVVATPAVRNLPKAKTRLARSLVPRSVKMEDAVLNIGHASAIVAGFSRGNVDMIGEAMEDALVEPHREKLVPGYRDVKREALSSGASGVAISGAGPSVIALIDRTQCDAKLVAKAMIRAFTRNGVSSGFFLSSPGQGARLVRGG